MDICAAIAGRRLIRFDYDGHERVVEPHTYGLIGGGRRAVCGYQVEGGSRSGSAAGWKTFHVDGMTKFEVLDRTFTRPRPEYRKDDRGFRRIFCDL